MKMIDVKVMPMHPVFSLLGAMSTLTLTPNGRYFVSARIRIIRINNDILSHVYNRGLNKKKNEFGTLIII